MLPEGSKVGDVLRVEADFAIDGIDILAVVPTREKAGKTGLLELLPSEKPFEAVTSQLAVRERRGRRDGGRGPRPDRRGDRPPRRDDGGENRGEGGGERRGDRRGERREGAGRPQGRQRPHFTPPPELPQRPKPKRLKPGRAHRNEVLAALPEEQRPVAERALQGGLPAVRQAVNEQNERLRAEGKEPVPAEGLLRMAEQLLPRLRVAEWRDRADAAKVDLEELDLRDLRSVVAAGDDPVVARDDSTRALANELREALAVKQEREMHLWLEDIEAALGVGRVIRALKLSGQPPKAGVRFPAELSTRLAEAATAALSPDDSAERWSALLEAVAFSPVRSQVAPAAAPATVADDLAATVKRLAPLLPQVAALFGIEVPAGAPMPKPLRPTRPAPARKSSSNKPD